MESEVIRYTFQGVQMSFRVMRGGTQAAMRLMAFLKAFFDKAKIETGIYSLREMVKKGEEINIGSIPTNNAEDFKKLAKEYALPYHPVETEKNTIDIMFKNSDLPKFNAVFERLNMIDKMFPNIQKYNVDDVRESKMQELERIKREQMEKAERSVERKISKDKKKKSGKKLRKAGHNIGER